jgi:hypothetical protein
MGGRVLFRSANWLAFVGCGGQGLREPPPPPPSPTTPTPPLASRWTVARCSSSRTGAGLCGCTARTSTDRPSPRGLRDVDAVRAWVLAQPWSDPARIALSGHSYGAYLTMLALGQQPTLWRPGVALSGSVDQARFLLSLPPDVRKRAAADFGDPDTESDLVERHSPIRFFDRVKAPLFVWQGEKDPVVKPAEAESAAALRGARGSPSSACSPQASSRATCPPGPPPRSTSSPAWAASSRSRESRRRAEPGSCELSAGATNLSQTICVTWERVLEPVTATIRRATAVSG